MVEGWVDFEEIRWSLRYLAAFLRGSGLLEGGFWCLYVGILYSSDIISLEYVIVTRYAAPLRPDVPEGIPFAWSWRGDSWIFDG